MKNKNLKLAMLALIGTATIAAQDLNINEVPSNLRTAFEQAHYGATDVEWEKDQDSYKVEFEIKREDYEIWYTTDGSISKMEKEIAENNLPQVIKSAINSKYPKYKIDSIEMMEENNSATYEVELKRGWNDEKHVIFTSDGKVLSDIDD